MFASLTKVVLGLAVGLAIAEWAFALRDEWAFPHVNFYVPDAELGTRLAPHAAQRLAFAGNPATELRTNALGFRGRDWPAPGPQDVLVVGDSQVFGLGVEEDATFSARLAQQLGGGARVLNAGVPTYGPLEYTALVERWVRERKPDKVVYVLNLANDLFELERPNRERHVVWDGWAVRKETAPAQPWSFPFRAWLMSQSHAVFALRSVLRGDAADDAQFASEGTWRELAARARHTPAQPAPSDQALAQAGAQRRELARELARVDESMVSTFARLAARDDRYRAVLRSLGQTQGDPRDIVRPTFAESARSVFTSAFQLLFAALALERNESMLRKLADETGDPELRALVDKRGKLREQLVGLSRSAADPRTPNALDALLERTLRACTAAHAELLLVLLPLDVQVSSAEWAKYSRPALDMQATRVLNEDVRERAARLGIRSLDLTETLRAAEPGAFLQGDLHMSARGHAAVARAIPAAFAAAAPQRSALPAGRSLLPTGGEWNAQEPMQVPGAEAASCEVRRVREWVQVRCASHVKDRARGLSLSRGGHGDALAGLEGTFEPKTVEPRTGRVIEWWDMRLILPMLPGDRASATFSWQHHSHAVQLSLLDAATLGVELGARAEAASLEGIQPQSIAASFERASAHDVGCHKRAAEAPPGDSETFQDRWQRCELGLRQACPKGELDFGVLGRCVAECSQSKPCARGSCVAWNGRSGCVEP